MSAPRAVPADPAGGGGPTAPHPPGPPATAERPDRRRKLLRYVRSVRRRRWPYALAVLALLAQMAIAMVTAAVEQTPTIDEPVYVGTAEVYLKERSLRYNPEHPPLGKLVVAAGLVFTDAHLDRGFTGSQKALGRHVLYEAGNDPDRLMLAARLPVIVLTLLFGLVVLAFARDLTGPAGGLVALALYAFSPDVIANGSLATLDVPAAGFLLTCAWLLWRAREHPRLHLPLAGAAFGAAAATKMSVLPLFPVLILSALLSHLHARRTPGPDRRARARLLLHAAVAAVGTALVAVAVVWAAYLVVDPRLRWAADANVPDIPGMRGRVAAWLPFPEAYRDGMRIQFGFEYDVWQGFLFGRLYEGSLWYYLPAALLVKTPLGALALWGAGAAALLAVRRLRPALPYVLLPAAVLLAVSMNGARDLGVRYAVFMPMFLAVAAAAVTLLRHRAVPWATAALVCFVAVSSLRTYPYYLPYSNEAFGGPSRTHLRLHDSNVDWGQDLGRLADHLHRHHSGERAWLVYKGAGVPAHYGIDASDPLKAPLGEVHGLLVVSDSAVAKADGRLAALLATSTPVDEVGHSITLYRRR
ncbi:ArnT family glycosyltransferase [Streptomyces apricus]|uniref:Glycosyltransferase family 39 protein n=1 Tax=Streptomyces apricus TaxID=1828112 RepID=A0A5B0BIV0_9ACTN|nr:glycosyltransferase family 39 protein [Streptomyces apricus]